MRRSRKEKNNQCSIIKANQERFNYYLIYIQLLIILSTKNAESNWNALRLANIALVKGDKVTIFLTKVLTF